MAVEVRSLGTYELRGFLLTHDIFPVAMKSAGVALTGFLLCAAISFSWADDPFQTAPAPGPDPFKMAPEAPAPKPPPHPAPQPREEAPAPAPAPVVAAPKPPPPPAGPFEGDYAGMREKQSSGSERHGGGDCPSSAPVSMTIRAGTVAFLTSGKEGGPMRFAGTVMPSGDITASFTSADGRTFTLRGAMANNGFSGSFAFGICYYSVSLTKH